MPLTKQCVEDSAAVTFADLGAPAKLGSQLDNAAAPAAAVAIGQGIDDPLEGRW